MRSMHELYALWDVLGAVPTNDEDEIEESFLHFPVGTHREDVWHWFESQHPAFLVGEANSKAYREAALAKDGAKRL